MSKKWFVCVCVLEVGGGIIFAGGQGHDDDEFEVRFPLNETANV